MIRHAPKGPYCGLTIILSNPSRFDRKSLLEGTGGHFFESECLHPHLTTSLCDVRLVDDPAPLLPSTKVILAFGQYAHSKLSGVSTTLDENRGSPLMYRDSIPLITTFPPQEAVDPFKFESRYNKEIKTIEDLESDDFDSDGLTDILESKEHGKTSISNYRFWVKQDTLKAIKILHNNGRIPSSGITPRYHIMPDADLVVKLLRETKGQHMFYDMETDFWSLDMRCFAFSFEQSPSDIYVVPVLDHHYQPAYGFSTQVQIHTAKSIAVRDSIVVAHNGAHFDFMVLALKYKIAVKKVYDTMLAAHRCYPTIEKSLGHWVSLCTFEPYHKNEGVHGYNNHTQAEQLYRYCGKDVYTMWLIKKWQDEWANRDAGLRNSIAQANAAVKPYLIQCLMGMHFNDGLRQSIINESDRKMMKYMEFMQDLTGPTVQPLISNKKCVEYFHNRLGYKSVKKTKLGNPSLQADALYKLGLAHNNPVIKLLIRYREVKKLIGDLKFKEWKKQQTMEGQLI